MSLLEVFHIANISPSTLVWHLSMFVPGFLGLQMYLINNIFPPHVASFGQSGLQTINSWSCVAENAPLCHFLAVWSTKKQRLVNLLKLIYQSACLQRALLVVLADKCRGEVRERVWVWIPPHLRNACRFFSKSADVRSGLGLKTASL